VPAMIISCCQALAGPIALFALALAGVAPRQNADRLPTLFVVGDSTVRNRTKGQQGWGDLLAAFFDKERIKVENHAIAGRSSRTFQTEGRWRRCWPGQGQVTSCSFSSATTTPGRSTTRNWRGAASEASATRRGRRHAHQPGRGEAERRLRHRGAAGLEGLHAEGPPVEWRAALDSGIFLGQDVRVDDADTPRVPLADDREHLRRVRHLMQQVLQGLRVHVVARIDDHKTTADGAVFAACLSLKDSQPNPPVVQAETANDATGDGSTFVHGRPFFISEVWHTDLISDIKPLFSIR